MTSCRLARALAILTLILIGVAESSAQFSEGGIGLSVALVPVSFEFDHADPGAAFSFDDTVYGIVFSRAGLNASIHRGTSKSSTKELDLFDINLSILGELLQDQLEGSPIFVPIMLHSTYRRVRRIEADSEFAAFEYTGIGLGAGVGLRHDQGRIHVMAHAIPGIGLATRSFGTSGGRTTLLDSDVQVSVDQVFGRFGLILGYGFRWQGWRVGGPDAFDAAGAGKVTYDGTNHALRVGLTW